MKGIISSIQPGTLGTSAAASASAGATTLVLSDSTDYSLTGGVLGLSESSSVRFSAIDEDTNVATLIDPLPADIEAGDPLTNITPSGRDAISFLVWADMQDGGGVHPYPADHSLVAFLTSKGDALSGSVAVIEEGLDLGPVVRSIINEDPQLDSAAVDHPILIAALLSNQSIPNDATGTTFTTLTGWTVLSTSGGETEITCDPATGLFTVNKDGHYSVSGGTSAIKWNSGAAGGRGIIRPWFNSLVFGSFPGGDSVVDLSAGHRTTNIVVNPLKEMSRGESFWFEVSQTSGSALSVIGDADGNSSFVCIEYRAPFLRTL